MKNRLRGGLQKNGGQLSRFIAQKYGMSKQVRYVHGHPLIPVGYIQTKAPLYKRREVNQYTAKGRESIHRNLTKIDMGILHFLM